MKNLKLKAARAAMGLSQQALAELCGVSRQTIVAIEKGDYNPTINLCRQICRVLGKTLDELLYQLYYTPNDYCQQQRRPWALQKSIHRSSPRFLLSA